MNSGHGQLLSLTVKKTSVHCSSQTPYCFSCAPCSQIAGCKTQQHHILLCVHGPMLTVLISSYWSHKAVVVSEWQHCNIWYKKINIVQSVPLAYLSASFTEEALRRCSLPFNCLASRMNFLGLSINSETFVFVSLGMPCLDLGIRFIIHRLTLRNYWYNFFKHLY